MKSKKLFTAISFTILVFGIMIVAPKAHAQSPTASPHENFIQGLIQVIAQKFGLDKNQVQTFANTYMQDQRKKMQDTMKKREEDRLTLLVQQGKITDTQKQAILKEIDTLKSKYSSTTMKNLTPDQRKQQFMNIQNELKSWAQSQGINVSLLKPGFGMGMRGGMKGTGGWRRSQ